MHVRNRAEIANITPENYINRTIHIDLMTHMKMPEVTVLYGARQVGKSSEIALIMSELLEAGNINIFYFNMDFQNEDFRDPEIFLNSIMSQRGTDQNKTYVFIDEAQQLTNVGLFIKYIYDKQLNIKFILTGSASLDIKEKIKEPLTGRKQEFVLYPLSLKEILNYKGLEISNISGDFGILQKTLSEYMLFGGYPAVVSQKNTELKKAKLTEIADSYIQRDIANLFNLDNSFNTKVVASFLAASIGSQYSIENISRVAHVTKTEVTKIVEALKKTFVVFDVYPFYKNKAKELVHKPKVYFYDLGIRNALLNKLDEASITVEKGPLFENTIATQLLHLYGIGLVKYWKTTNQTEVDFIVEITSDKLLAYETKFSWKPGKTAKSLESFKNVYASMIESAEVLSASNYWRVFTATL